jgi:hypothetical protein
MAALRHAARSLIDGQRPQAVYKVVVSPLVEQERRRLLPSLVHGGQRPSSSPLRSLSSSSSGATAYYFHPPLNLKVTSSDLKSQVFPPTLCETKILFVCKLQHLCTCVRRCSVLTSASQDRKNWIFSYVISYYIRSEI